MGDKEDRRITCLETRKVRSRKIMITAKTVAEAEVSYETTSEIIQKAY